MTDAAVIKAAFSEWQMIKTRKVLQLRFEVPLEQGERVLRILGMPMPHEETWCAIALLNIPAAAGAAAGTAPGGKEDASSAPTPGLTASQQAKERYRQAPEWQKAAMRASILCGDPQFQQWASKQVISPWHGRPLPDVAHWMRWKLGITSRSEIGTDRAVYERFIALETEYLQSVGRLAEARE